MKFNVKLPKVSDATDEVLILDVLASVGDRVSEGDSLLEVETDKISVEVPSPVTGTVLEVLVAADQEITTGTPILSMEAS